MQHLSIAIAVLLGLLPGTMRAADSYVNPAASQVLSSEVLAKLTSATLDGDAEAARAIADHFAFGKQDQASASHWYRVSASLGSVESQRILAGVLYSSDSSPDKIEAVAWWSRAASKGDVVAAERLAQAMSKGFAEAVSKDEREEPYRLAAAKGSILAAQRLATLLLQRNPTSERRKEAFEVLDRACRTSLLSLPTHAAVCKSRDELKAD